MQHVEDNAAVKGRFAVVDLFAGPGGLAEGFASLRDDAGDHPFSVALSIEKEPSAHATLLLRSFVRQFGDELPDEYGEFLNGGVSEPDWESLYPVQWQAAEREARCLTLGESDADEFLAPVLEAIRDRFHGDTVLIGGPPCQAYSLVGRARNRGIATYVAEDDQRHYLYREYVAILQRLRPAAFVMENVKGMLSAFVEGKNVFARVLEDLSAAGGPGEGYRFVPISPRQSRNPGFGWESTDPRDYVVRAEEHGVPQARHRVIVVGIREDVLRRSGAPVAGPLIHRTAEHVFVRDMLESLPRLRSGLSKSADSDEAWRTAMANAMDCVATLPINLPTDQFAVFRDRVRHYRAALLPENTPPRRASRISSKRRADDDPLQRWLRHDTDGALANHESRGHMPMDLARYFFAAVFAEASGRSPKMADFPLGLAPGHRNWTTGKFADRFRVQLWERPSTTVTSHIAKDGHYFIHPDPGQVRSLTVREAARLQTFPDNYFFKGNRTQQYTQVGNAVPPWLARQIAGAVLGLLTGSPATHMATSTQLAAASRGEELDRSPA